MAIRRFWVTLGAIGWILLAPLFLTGCQPAILKTQAAQASQIVLAILSDPKTFNPILNQEFPHIFLFAFEGLTKEDGISGEVQPALAESWTISPDRRRVTFTLRENLQWSDGHPLTADDVVFTYGEVLFNPDIPSDQKDPLRIGESGAFPTVRKLSDRAVEFTLPEPFAPFLRATSNIWLVPAHILRPTVEQRNRDGDPLLISTWNTGTNPANIVTNGPYLIESYDPSQRVVFRRNPYYWRRDDQGNRLPYIDRIVWQVVESTDTQLLQFRSGKLDIMGDSRPVRSEYFSLLKREEQRGRFTLEVGGPWSGTTFLSFNLNRATNERGQPLVDPIKSKWFNTPEFRQAVAYALNRDAMVNNVFRGVGVIQNSPVSVQSPYFLTPEAGLKVYDYDPEKAKRLLESVGFQYNTQGQLLDADGNRVRFTLLTNSGNKNREGMGVQIRQDLSKIGIQVDFQPIAFNTLVSRLTNSRDWDAHIIGFTGGVEPHSTANLWTSTGGSHNFNLGPQPGQPPIQGWEVSDWEREIDRLFIAGAQELDETRRKAIYAEFQRIAQEQLPLIYLVNEVALMAVRDRVTNLKYSGLPTWGLWNIYELQLAEN
ncbi:MAG: ABC transporter substrate-binding protein [Desertifilum sp. SIO1I2]|nr:ABC transporter substrate-binding protein [Desertifilum sp. SIO1I2]